MARVRVQGPWRGMDLRDADAPQGTSRLMINMENKSGVLRPRAPMQSLRETLPQNAQLHFVNRPGLARYILAVGPKDTGGILGRIVCSIYDEWGGIVDENTWLTTETHRPSHTGFRCSFVDTFLRSTDGTPRPVTLIVTPNSTWVFEPLANALTVRQAEVATDASQINTANLSYWLSVPRGPIAVMHGSRVAYAGFQDGADIVFDSPIEDDATDVPEELLGQNRASLRGAPGLLYLADEYDPIGITASSFFFIADEEITGLHSTGEVLLVFTNKGIHALSGYDVQTFAIQKLTGGTGCASHWSIVTVGGVTYFASADGIYAFGGLGAPEVVCISDGLAPLWEGWEGCSTFLPDAMTSRLTNLGWPWQVKTDLAAMTCGRHNVRDAKIWWSLPVTGPWALGGIGMAAVFDLGTNGWSLYFCDPFEARLDDQLFTIMADAVDVNGRWMTSNSTGSLLMPGGVNYDGPYSSSTGCMGVPAFWLSQRFAPDDADWKKVLDTRVKLLARGNYQSAYGGDAEDALGSGGVPKDLPFFVLSGEAEGFDMFSDGGVAAGYSNRGSTVTEKLILCPHAGLPTLNGYGANPAWTLNTHPWIGKDWWASRCEGQIGAKAFRFGLVDDAWANTRGPKVAVVAIEFDVLVEGTTHR